MRKITLSEFVSLDGVIEEPRWTAPYWNDVIQDFKFNELFGHDALLLGRVTYQGFAQAWPGQTDEQGYANRMNTMPKHVVSSTLDKADWSGSSIVKGDIFGQIEQLRQQDGQDILIFGSGKLATALIQRGLIDRYNLIIYPIVIGRGQKLFNDGDNVKLTLAESRPTPSGATIMIYESVPAEQK